MSKYYHWLGHELELFEWADLFKQPRHVGYHILAYAGSKMAISTVWLGLDHQFGDGPPLIFETMLFQDGSGMDEYCERYSTFEAAFDRHWAFVDQMIERGARIVVDPNSPDHKLLTHPARKRRRGPGGAS